MLPFIAAFLFAAWQKAFFLTAADSSFRQPVPFRVAASDTLSAPATGSMPTDAPMGISSDAHMMHAISYGPSPVEIADLCLPNVAYADAPAIVFIHGGGWARGGQMSLDKVCQDAASRGIVGMTIQYRLSPPNNWPSQLEDAQLAVRWLRAHAREYKVDPARICSWGRSAGGHLAVFLGVLQTAQPGDRANLYANESSTVACVVDDFGPVDLTNAGNLQHRVTALVGNDINLPDALRSASPLFLVDAHSAPMIIVQGDNDRTVDHTEQSEKLYQALRKQGVLAQMLVYHGGHGFRGISPDETKHYEDVSLQFVITTLGHKHNG